MSEILPGRVNPGNDGPVRHPAGATRVASGGYPGGREPPMTEMPSMTQPDEPAKQGVDPTAPYPSYSPDPYAPPAAGQPPAYNPAYGQPPGYEAPAGYAAPSGYEAQAGYAAPAAYSQPAQPAYGGYPGYPYPVVAEPTNGLAIASLVVSIIGAAGLCAYGLGGYLGIVGAILGHVAGRQIRERGGQGAGMAKAGVIIGWIVTGIAVLATIAIVIFVVWAANQPPSTFD
jgi:hypothetical protein